MKPEQKHKGHPHAELAKLYAEDMAETEKAEERWEFNGGNGWHPCLFHPTWDKDYQYRRKPHFIEINGHQVPEPVRSRLQDNEIYYYPVVSLRDLFYESSWEGDERDLNRLRAGIIHLSREAAITHAKALLSFTCHDHQNP